MLRDSFIEVCSFVESISKFCRSKVGTYNLLSSGVASLCFASLVHHDNHPPLDGYALERSLHADGVDGLELPGVTAQRHNTASVIDIDKRSYLSKQTERTLARRHHPDKTLFFFSPQIRYSRRWLHSLDRNSVR